MAAVLFVSVAEGGPPRGCPDQGVRGVCRTPSAYAYRWRVAARALASDGLCPAAARCLGGTGMRVIPYPFGVCGSAAARRAGSSTVPSARIRRRPSRSGGAASALGSRSRTGGRRSLSPTWQLAVWRARFMPGGRGRAITGPAATTLLCAGSADGPPAGLGPVRSMPQASAILPGGIP
jgi:hypothetical protein